MAISRESMRDMLERSRFAIRWGGALGLLCHPIYYVVWTYILPQPYDNLWLRFLCDQFCNLLHSLRFSNGCTAKL